MAPNTSNPLRQLLLELHACQLHEQALSQRVWPLRPSAFNEHLGYIDHEGYRYWRDRDKQTGSIIYKKKRLPNGKTEDSDEKEFHTAQIAKRQSASKPTKQPTSQAVKPTDSVPTSSLPGMDKYRKEVFLRLANNDILTKTRNGNIFLERYNPDDNSHVRATQVDPSEWDKAVTEISKSKATEASKDKPLAEGDDVLPYLLARYDANDGSTDELYPRRSSKDPLPADPRSLQYLYGYQDESFSNIPKHLPKDVISRLFENQEIVACIDQYRFEAEIDNYSADSDDFRDSDPDDLEHNRREKIERGRELSRQIEALLQKAGFDRGPLFRGINANLDTVRRYLDIGYVHNQRGISSWTTEMKTAIDFTSSPPDKPFQIIFIEASTQKKKALSIASISRHSRENECIYPDSVRFKVKDFKLVDLGGLLVEPTILIEVEETLDGLHEQ